MCKATEGRYPATLVSSNGMVCVGLDKGTVIALDAETGQESWRLKTNFKLSTVIADADSLYFGSWPYLKAVELRTGKVKWLSEKGYNGAGSTAAIVDGEIYFQDGDYIHVVNVLTGQESWRYGRQGRGQSLLAVSDRKIFFTDGDYFYAVDTLTKKQLWKIELKEESGVEAAPVVTSGAVCFIEGCALMTAADIKTGKPRWKFTS